MLINFQISKKFIYFIYFIPSAILSKLFEEKFSTLININQLINSISQLLMIILYFYQKFQIKKNNYIKKKDYFQIKTIILFICSIIFSLIQIVLNKFIYINYFSKDIIHKAFDFILIILIDRIIFNPYIYSHHILSIFISLISLFIQFLNEKNKVSLIYIIIILLNNYCNAFYLLLIYQINLKYFINIFLLGSLTGFFSLIFQLFFFISYDDIIFILKYNMGKFLIFYCFICFIYYIFLYYIIWKLGPIHSLLCYKIPYCLFNYNRSQILIIDLIACLIYLEILEFNFCKLNYNLKKNIILRENQEKIIILKNLSSKCETNK